MPISKKVLSLVTSLSVFLTVFLPLPAVNAQDLVATDDLAGGSSIFVFRGSRKKPQVHAGGGKLRIGQSAGRSSGGQAASRQIVLLAKKRRDSSAVDRGKAVIAAANRKVALSNTLAAKADGFLDSGQTDLAINNYRAALAQSAKNKRASDGLSNALTSKGIDVAGAANNEAAIPFFEEAVKVDTKNDAAYAKLGAIHDGKGRKAQAIANYEKALAINGEYTMLYEPLAMAYRETGEVAKATASLDRASAAGIDTADTRYARALLLYKENKNEEAIVAFDKALAIDPTNSSALAYKAHALERVGRSDDAVAGYEMAVAAEPGDPAASFDLGVAYYNKGQYDKAEKAYKQSLQSDPNNAETHANLASTYRQLERYPEANAEYKAAAIGIKTVDLFSEWGFCLGKTAEWEKAVARLNTAKEMSPAAIDNNNLGWAYYNAGHTSSAAKNDAAAKANYQQSKVYLRKAIEQDPKLDAAYVNLGATHNGLGEFQDAVTALNIANQLHPSWPIALNQLGVGYRGLNDLVNAINAFKQVVNLDGNSLSGLFYLGEAYNASGNKKEAKRINDKLKKLDPTLALRLDNVFKGKEQLNNVQRSIETKVPKVPMILRFP